MLKVEHASKCIPTGDVPPPSAAATLTATVSARAQALQKSNPALSLHVLGAGQQTKCREQRQEPLQGSLEPDVFTEEWLLQEAQRKEKEAEEAEAWWTTGSGCSTSDDSGGKTSSSSEDNDSDSEESEGKSSSSSEENDSDSEESEGKSRSSCEDETSGSSEESESKACSSSQDNTSGSQESESKSSSSSEDDGGCKEPAAKDAAAAVAGLGTDALCLPSPHVLGAGQRKLKEAEEAEAWWTTGSGCSTSDDSDGKTSSSSEDNDSDSEESESKSSSSSEDSAASEESEGKSSSSSEDNTSGSSEESESKSSSSSEDNTSGSSEKSESKSSSSSEDDGGSKEPAAKDAAAAVAGLGTDALCLLLPHVLGAGQTKCREQRQEPQQGSLEPDVFTEEWLLQDAQRKEKEAEEAEAFWNTPWHDGASNGVLRESSSPHRGESARSDTDSKFTAESPGGGRAPNTGTASWWQWQQQATTSEHIGDAADADAVHRAALARWLVNRAGFLIHILTYWLSHVQPEGHRDVLFSGCWWPLASLLPYIPPDLASQRRGVAWASTSRALAGYDGDLDASHPAETVLHCARLAALAAVMAVLGEEGSCSSELAREAAVQSAGVAERCRQLLRAGTDPQAATRAAKRLAQWLEDAAGGRQQQLEQISGPRVTGGRSSGATRRMCAMRAAATLGAVSCLLRAGYLDVSSLPHDLGAPSNGSGRSQGDASRTRARQAFFSALMQLLSTACTQFAAEAVPMPAADPGQPALPPDQRAGHVVSALVLQQVEGRPGWGEDEHWLAVSLTAAVDKAGGVTQQQSVEELRALEIRLGELLLLAEAEARMVDAAAGRADHTLTSGTTPGNTTCGQVASTLGLWGDPESQPGIMRVLVKVQEAAELWAAPRAEHFFSSNADEANAAISESIVLCGRLLGAVFDVRGASAAARRLAQMLGCSGACVGRRAGLSAAPAPLEKCGVALPAAFLTLKALVADGGLGVAELRSCVQAAAARGGPSSGTRWWPRKAEGVWWEYLLQLLRRMRFLAAGIVEVVEAAREAVGRQDGHTEDLEAGPVQDSSGGGGLVYADDCDMEAAVAEPACLVTRNGGGESSDGIAHNGSPYSAINLVSEGEHSSGGADVGTQGQCGGVGRHEAGAAAVAANDPGRSSSHTTGGTLSLPQRPPQCRRDVPSERLLTGPAPPSVTLLPQPHLSPRELAPKAGRLRRQPPRVAHTAVGLPLQQDAQDSIAGPPNKTGDDGGAASPAPLPGRSVLDTGAARRPDKQPAQQQVQGGSKRKASQRLEKLGVAALSGVVFPTTWTELFGAAAAADALCTTAVEVRNQERRRERGAGGAPPAAAAEDSVTVVIPACLMTRIHEPADQKAAAQGGSGADMPEADTDDRRAEDQEEGGEEEESDCIEPDSLRFASPQTEPGSSKRGLGAAGCSSRAAAKVGGADSSGTRKRKQLLRPAAGSSGAMPGAPGPADGILAAPPGFRFVALLLLPGFRSFARGRKGAVPPLMIVHGGPHPQSGSGGMAAVRCEPAGSVVSRLGPNCRADWESVLFVALAPGAGEVQQVLPLGLWRSESSNPLPRTLPWGGPAVRLELSLAGTAAVTADVPGGRQQGQQQLQAPLPMQQQQAPMPMQQQAPQAMQQQQGPLPMQQHQQAPLPMQQQQQGPLPMQRQQAPLAMQQQQGPLPMQRQQAPLPMQQQGPLAMQQQQAPLAMQQQQQAPLPMQRQQQAPLPMQRQQQAPLPMQRQQQGPLAMQRQQQGPLAMQQQAPLPMQPQQPQVTISTSTAQPPDAAGRPGATAGNVLQEHGSIRWPHVGQPGAPEASAAPRSPRSGSADGAGSAEVDMVPETDLDEEEDEPRPEGVCAAHEYGEQVQVQKEHPGEEQAPQQAPRQAPRQVPQQAPQRLEGPTGAPAGAHNLIPPFAARSDTWQKQDVREEARRLIQTCTRGLENHEPHPSGAHRPSACQTAQELPAAADAASGLLAGTLGAAAPPAAASVPVPGASGPSVVLSPVVRSAGSAGDKTTVRGSSRAVQDRLGALVAELTDSHASRAASLSAGPCGAVRWDQQEQEVQGGPELRHNATGALPAPSRCSGGAAFQQLSSGPDVPSSSPPEPLAGRQRQLESGDAEGLRRGLPRGTHAPCPGEGAGEVGQLSVGQLPSNANCLEPSSGDDELQRQQRRASVLVETMRSSGGGGGSDADRAPAASPAPDGGGGGVLGDLTGPETGTALKDKPVWEGPLGQRAKKRVRFGEAVAIDDHPQKRSRSKSASPLRQLGFSGGGATASDGGATASDGGATASDGCATASDGGATASDGGATASGGGATASDGGATASDGGATASGGGATASDGGATASGGGATASDGEEAAAAGLVAGAAMDVEPLATAGQRAALEPELSGSVSGAAAAAAASGKASGGVAISTAIDTAGEAVVCAGATAVGNYGVASSVSSLEASTSGASSVQAYRAEVPLVRAAAVPTASEDAGSSPGGCELPLELLSTIPEPSTNPPTNPSSATAIKVREGIVGGSSGKAWVSTAPDATVAPDAVPGDLTGPEAGTALKDKPVWEGPLGQRAKKRVRFGEAVVIDDHPQKRNRSKSASPLRQLGSSDGGANAGGGGANASGGGANASGGGANASEGGANASDGEAAAATRRVAGAAMDVEPLATAEQVCVVATARFPELHAAPLPTLGGGCTSCEGEGSVDGR